ncbi:MAG: PHP domain-containing protein [Candidatus Methanoperedens sp.]|nr:PHP domain-containing protein [Candidatus Methanoperedens sp.]
MKRVPTIYNLDLHVHSKYSHDSTLQPETIIKISRKRGLSGIAITDHNTMAGAEKMRSLAGDDFMVIPGSEISTDKGDVIGLFLNENITSRRFIDVIDIIKDQGGISILPHPYKNKFANPEDLVTDVDMVEVMNSRISKKLNEKASILSKKFGKKIAAGSDAHTSFEIGRVRLVLTGERISNNSEDIRKYLLDGKVNTWGNTSPFHIRMLSAGIGKYNKAGITGLFNAGLRKILLR